MSDMTLEMAETAGQGGAGIGAGAARPDDRHGGQILPTLGGSPITRGGRIIGAIGCGGGTGEQDQECADAGAAALAS